jgi:hypothetical protein
VADRRRSSRTGKLEVVTPQGDRLALDGRRADVVALLAVELLRRPWLDSSVVWNVQVNVTQGQVLVHCGDTSPPWKFKEAG